MIEFMFAIFVLAAAKLGTLVGFLAVCAAPFAVFNATVTGRVLTLCTRLVR
jgi:hypothetical protein